MQNHKIFLRITLVIFCLHSIQCAVTNVPRGWFTKPDQITTDTYGSWINIKTRDEQIRGELVAVTKDTVFVVDTILKSIVTSNIVSARLVIYDTGRYLILSVIGGTILTISNGFYLILTAPIWIIGGTIAVISRSFDPVIDYPDKPLEEFKKFARYPQGLPTDIDRNMIKIKAIVRR